MASEIVQQDCDTDGDTAAADWLFSQREIIVRGGTLRWTRERPALPHLRGDGRIDG